MISLRQEREFAWLLSLRHLRGARADHGIVVEGVGLAQIMKVAGANHSDSQIFADRRQLAIGFDLGKMALTLQRLADVLQCRVGADLGRGSDGDSALPL